MREEDLVYISVRLMAGAGEQSIGGSFVHCVVIRVITSSRRRLSAAAKRLHIIDVYEVASAHLQFEGVVTERCTTHRRRGSICQQNKSYMAPLSCQDTQYS